MPNEAIPLTDARRRLGAIAAKVRSGRHVELTEHGYPFAVLVPIADYRNLTAETEENQ